MDVINFEKYFKNEEFKNNFNLFKNKINELIFSDLCFESTNTKYNKNNQIIPKYFRDKIHSIEKINGNFQICAFCFDKNKRVDYFCKNCKIPIHPECFTDYHNNNVYNSI